MSAFAGAPAAAVATLLKACVYLLKETAPGMCVRADESTLNCAAAAATAGVRCKREKACDVR